MLEAAIQVKDGASKKDKPRTWLEARLIEMGWDIDDLARTADMSYSQVHDIVTKGIRPGTRIGNIEKIANAISISVVSLLDNQERAE